jgi:tight adherence protein C
MSPELLLTLVGVFGAVALVTGSLASFVLTHNAPERRRLRSTRPVATSGVLLEGATLTPETPDIVKTMSTLIPRSPKDMSALRRRMARAGFHTMTPIGVYTAGQLFCPLALGGTSLFFFPPPNGWLLAMCFAGIGFLIPSLILGRLILRRQKVIQNGLPDALDLLVVCLEAGSSLDQAILKAGDELVLAYPALSEELQMLITETRAGKPRLEAFRNFASRTGVDDVRALVAMLVQTDRFGTSVGQALRTHAETSRTKRRQRAEERAAKIGVKLVFPLVFLLFPALFVVLLGPAVIQFIRFFGGQI